MKGRSDALLRLGVGARESVREVRGQLSRLYALRRSTHLVPSSTTLPMITGIRLYVPLTMRSLGRMSSHDPFHSPSTTGYHGNQPFVGERSERVLVACMKSARDMSRRQLMSSSLEGGP